MTDLDADVGRLTGERDAAEEAVKEAGAQLEALAAEKEDLEKQLAGLGKDSVEMAARMVQLEKAVKARAASTLPADALVSASHARARLLCPSGRGGRCCVAQG